MYIDILNNFISATVTNESFLVSINIILNAGIQHEEFHCMNSQMVIYVQVT